MAVNNVPVGSVLRLQLQSGVDGSGDPIIRNKSLSNVKPEALEQDIFDVAQVWFYYRNMSWKTCCALTAPGWKRKFNPTTN